MRLTSSANFAQAWANVLAGRFPANSDSWRKTHAAASLLVLKLALARRRSTHTSALHWLPRFLIEPTGVKVGVEGCENVSQDTTTPDADAKKAAIQAAIERAKAKKAGVVPKNIDNLPPDKQAEIAEIESRRAKIREIANQPVEPEGH